MVIMRETDKEVLRRMCDKIKLSDMQREDIMKRINEEVSEKKHRSFNVKRLATVMVCALVLVGATIGVGAKLNIADKISDVYTKWQSWNPDKEVVFNENEKQIVEDLSIDVGYEFEVDGGKVRIDGIMYDSTILYLTYTAIADDGKMETAMKLLRGEHGANEGLTFIMKGNLDVRFGGRTMDIDLDENAEGYQGCVIASVRPLYSIANYETGEWTGYNNFTFAQGDEIVLTDMKYMKPGIIMSLDDVERIYGILELTKPIDNLVFKSENTEGMDVLETVTEIRISPLSVAIMGDELLRKTYPEGVGYTYYERGDRVLKTGTTGDPEIDKAEGGYAVRVVKKDGSVVEIDPVGHERGKWSQKAFEFFYNAYCFEKPLDLTEVDYILVWGWGLEYKIPVNVTE